jgi:HlyD family secretion protein
MGQALYNDAIEQHLTVGAPVSFRRLKRPGPHVMKRKRSRSASLVMAACVFFLTGCASSALPPTAPKTAPAGLHRGTLEDRFLLSGELRAVRSLKLVVPRTPTWSIGLKWLAQEGTRVKAGDPVAQLDTSGILSSLEDKRQELIEAELQLQKTRSELAIQRLQKSLEVLKKRNERDKARLDTGVPAQLRSPRDYQEKQLALDKAEVALSKAERERRDAEQQEATQIGVLSIQRDKVRRQVLKAEGLLESLTLRAPQPGILIHSQHPWEERTWKVGDTVQAGMAVVELPDLSEMYVEARLSDLDDGEALPGMPARCRLDALPNRVFPGRVTSVNGVADEITTWRGIVRTFRVRLDLEQSDPDLMRPGMSAKVEVIRASLPDRLLLPRALLEIGASGARLVRPHGRGPDVPIEACNSLECALAGDPAKITALVSAP